MSSWVWESIDPENFQNARTEASRRLLERALTSDITAADNRDLVFMASAAELAVFDVMDDEGKSDSLKHYAADAFYLFRVLPPPVNTFERAKWLIRVACLGVLGDRGVDASKVLRDNSLPTIAADSDNWGERVLSTIINAWLCLLRKDGWEDLRNAQELVLSLRLQQKDFEEDYLNSAGDSPRTAAWELIALYHIAKAADLLAEYTTQGMIGDNTFDVRQQIEAQFDRAIIACERAELIELETFCRLLFRTARQMIDNSIWTVTRAVNSRVTKFVEQLVSPERIKPIFEMLPPQRRALREQGLLGSGHRSVVVNLPTSSGKTFIAEFRILQALNQFDFESGWVAYLAPTRALVNQICTRLRRDFELLNIAVDKVNPALEVDGIEESLLTDKDRSTQFRVLVTTPEKLDLLIRNEWEEKIGRPLTLVIVDEAHNMSQIGRGIKLELLLATINRECRNSQFLLLTPFISNATEIAKWLSPDSYQDINIGIAWKPNDTAIVLSKPELESGRNFKISIKTLHTNRDTISIPDEIPIFHGRPLNLTYKKVTFGASKLSALAASTAYSLKNRGPIIVLVQRPDWTWSLARYFMRPENRIPDHLVPKNIKLAKSFLADEFGDDFELIQLLDYGVGVHHSGLSDEAKLLMEWLLETKCLQILVATTTISQGLNFPVASIVLAHYNYPQKGVTVDMPAEDFWNLAGRVGRVEQGSVGIVAFASPNLQSDERITKFVNRSVEALNSSLISMVQAALEFGDLDQLEKFYYKPEWSAFLQYLVHSYRQIGNYDQFITQIEQVLRGTLGFQMLRTRSSVQANRLLFGVQKYASSLSGKPLKLVDSTGFSLESVMATLARISENKITAAVWNPNTLFDNKSHDLKNVMGILLAVPELREDLELAAGKAGKDGDKLARMVIDWVAGETIETMARKYFVDTEDGSPNQWTKSLTSCCRNVFGRLVQTTSWGISALQSMTLNGVDGQLSEDERRVLSNLPARVFYGVNDDDALTLRVLGVPRLAASKLAAHLREETRRPLTELRMVIRNLDEETWVKFIGSKGADYRKVWLLMDTGSLD